VDKGQVLRDEKYFYALIFCCLEVNHLKGTPTKRQVSKRQISKRPVSKRLKRQAYKTSGLQNVRFTKRSVAKKHPYILCTCGWWKSTGSVSAFCLWMSHPVVMDVSACRISDFNYIITFLLYMNRSIPQCRCSANLI
jgi:hypothetical protein